MKLLDRCRDHMTRVVIGGHVIPDGPLWLDTYILSRILRVSDGDFIIVITIIIQ
jgi:hypothetical protein